jgi:SAM-dependent methyltransferase
MNTHKEWFSEWFDSPYYHILYHQRDEQEAEFFLDNVVKKTAMHPDIRILDLACGKGRHAVYLNKLGFDVTGVDLSVRSIAQAATYSNSRLRFEVHDLRNYISRDKFDLALNLFTSFGYFQSAEEDEQVLLNIHESLTENGLLLIDFMNIEKVLSTLVEHESKTLDGIQFTISRWTDDQFLYKKIQCTESSTTFEFTEKVQLISRAKFEQLLQRTGFQILEVMGNYNLDPFRISESDRLILLTKRI